MQLDFSQLSASQIYHCMTQTIVPRPVAWLLTDNGEGMHYNLAPFSYFNAVCSDPPLVMVSIGKKPDGSDKDTVVNIQQRRFATLHIASAEQAEQVTESSRTREFGDSEVLAQDLALVEQPGFNLPRLANAPIAMDCELYEIQKLGATPQSLVFLKVLQLYIEEQYLEASSERVLVDHQSLNPLGRLGGSQYWANGETLSVARPK